MDRSHASGAAAFAAIVLVVAACTSSPATASPSPAPQSPGASPTAAGSVAVTSPSASAATTGQLEPQFAPACQVPTGKTFKVALIIAQGGLGDQSYNDLAYSGFQRAQRDFPLVGRVIQSTDVVAQGQALVQQAGGAAFDLVIDLEFSHNDAIKAIAPKFANTHWVNVNFTSLGPNVTGYIFREQDGSYLAGALAAMVTKDPSIQGTNPDAVIGAIGGVKAVGIDKFIVGYIQGAHDIDPAVKVLVSYSNNFGDPAKGKELTDAMFDQGADIVYQIAGGTGQGVIEAAKDANHFAIGVDSDQDALAPGHVLTSMVKRTDFVVYDAIDRLVCGTLKGGDTIELGLKEGAIGLSPMKFTRDLIPASHLQKVDELRQKILSGEIKVWNTITDGNPDWFK